ESASFSPRAAAIRPTAAVTEIAGATPRIAGLLRQGVDRVLASTGMAAAGGPADVQLQMHLFLDKPTDGRRDARVAIGARLGARAVLYPEKLMRTRAFAQCAALAAMLAATLGAALAQPAAPQGAPAAAKPPAKTEIPALVTAVEESTLSSQMAGKIRHVTGGLRSEGRRVG